MVFVHHTASGNTYTAAEAPAIMRAIYAYHTRSLGWSDIGYNFLIDRFGTIYEGRYGGMKRGVVGAQVLGFNRGSSGISVIGDFAADAPPAAALAALREAARLEAQDPPSRPEGDGQVELLLVGEVRHGRQSDLPRRRRPPPGQPHRSAPATSSTRCCPRVRLEAAGRPQPPIVALVRAGPARFSPNGDGVLG